MSNAIKPSELINVKLNRIATELPNMLKAAKYH